MKNKKKLTLVQGILLVLLVQLAVAAVHAFVLQFYTREDVMLATVFHMVQVALIFLYCLDLRKLRDRFAYLAFHVAYTVLLQGTYFAEFGNPAFYGNFHYSAVVRIHYVNQVRGLFYILLSQLVVFAAYTYDEWKEIRWVTSIRYRLCKLLPDRKTHRISRRSHNLEDRNTICWIRRISMFFMIAGGVAAFTKLGLKIAFVLTHDYLDTYLNTGDALYQNPILDLFDKFYFLGFYGYLCTFPKKKQLIFPVVLYGVFAVLTLMTGVRGDLVVNTLFLIWYLFQWDRNAEGQKPFLPVRRILMLAVLGLGGFVFLYYFGRRRLGITDDEFSLLGGLVGFIKSQGGSGQLVETGLEFREELHTYLSSFMMVFSPIRNFLINNSLVRMFTGGALGQTVENLYRAGSFGDVLTYLTNPDSYLSGAGIGTCYVAELAVAMGGLGVTAFSIFLGWILKRMDRLIPRRWISNMLLMNIVGTIIYIPRHAALGFIPESLSVVVYIFIVLVCLHFIDFLQRKKEEHSV